MYGFLEFEVVVLLLGNVVELEETLAFRLVFLVGHTLLRVVGILVLRLQVGQVLLQHFHVVTEFLRFLAGFLLLLALDGMLVDIS